MVNFKTKCLEVTTYAKTPMFTENQHLVGFSLIMKVSLQRNKREDFYTHYFKGVLAYVVTSRHFVLKLKADKLTNKAR